MRGLAADSPTTPKHAAGVRWRGHAQSALDQTQRTYGYLYDKSNRLTGAAYVAKGTANWDQEDDYYDVGDISYDGNGNILTLGRNGLTNYDLDAMSVYTQLDDMVFTYEGNQLKAVNDQAANGVKSRGDFFDGAEKSTEYSYDANGNMKVDENKSISNIAYNYLNLPETVTFESGDQIKFIYDAAGAKHQQLVYEGGQLTKITEYIGEVIYEDSTLAYIQHEEGRIIPGEIPGFEYQYYYKDHLGNIRMTFTAPKEAVEYIATMETSNATEEEAEFGNVAETRQLDQAQAHSGTASARLNGFDNRIIGPAKSLAIGKGDTVKIEVYAKYNQTTNNTTTLVSGLAAAVTDAFGLVGGGETQVAYDAISSLLSAGSGLISSDDDIPLAYVNYLLFNEDYLLVDFGYQQISTTALNNPHEQLSLTAIAPQNGFAYIYVTNESALDLDVFFDDLKITHVQHPIVQETHYYPYGLALNGIGKEGNNPYKYNGFEEQDELDLGLYDYQSRYYDPALGRFISVDPAADLMRRYSPYNYAFDNPIRFTDPDGMAPEEGGKEEEDEEVKRDINFEYDDEGNITRANVDIGYSDGNQSQGDDNSYRAFTNIEGFGNRAETNSSGNNVNNSGNSANTTTGPRPGTLKLPKRSDYPDGAFGDFLYKLEITLLETSFFPGLGGIGSKGASGAGAISKWLSRILGKGSIPANRLHHIFGESGHALDDLVRQFGSQEKAFKAVQNAANQALRNGQLTPNARGILPSGNAGNIIKVGGTNVRLIGGRIVDNKVIISSFSRRGL